MNTTKRAPRTATKHCLRCGIPVWAGCCRDCWTVAPEHCRNLIAEATR